jgi:hypothetical protein
METILTNLPEWMILLAVVIYGVVKLGFEAVSRANERASAAERKAKPSSIPPKRGDHTGPHDLDLDRMLDAREERERTQEMHSLLKKQDEIIAQLAAASSQQAKVLEALAGTSARQEAMLEHQTRMLESHAAGMQGIARNQIRMMESWSVLTSVRERDGVSPIRGRRLEVVEPKEG